MMTTTTKRQLFGGALMCAGLAAAAMPESAMAAFVPVWAGYPSSYSRLYARDLGGNQVVDALEFTTFGSEWPSTLDATNNDGSLVAHTSRFLFGAYAQIDNPLAWNDVGSIKHQYFTVSFSKGATVYWDFTHANSISTVSIAQVGVGELMSASPGSAGSMFFNFEKDEVYVFHALVGLSFASPGDSAYATLLWHVPAPGALALLGIGMVGTQRRRDHSGDVR